MYLEVALEALEEHGADERAQLGHEQHGPLLPPALVPVAAALLALARQTDEQRLLGLADAHVVALGVVVEEGGGLARAQLERALRTLVPRDVVDAVRLLVVADRKGGLSASG